MGEEIGELFFVLHSGGESAIFQFGQDFDGYSPSDVDSAACDIAEGEVSSLRTVDFDPQIQGGYTYGTFAGKTTTGDSRRWIHGSVVKAGMTPEQIVEIRQFISQMGVSADITHPTTTLEDLFMRIVREGTGNQSAAAGSNGERATVSVGA